MRLVESLDKPLTAPGSQQIAWLVLAPYNKDDLANIIDQWVGKILQTLSDAECHSTMLVPPSGDRLVIAFMAWPGTYQEAQPLRFGQYLEGLFGLGRRLVEMGIAAHGLLQIDAYVREWADPPVVMESKVVVDVEYSFLPGHYFGGVEPKSQELHAMLVDKNLCTAAELQEMERFMA